MAKCWKPRTRLFVLISSLAIPGINILFPVGRAFAQIVPDKTLGAEGSIVTHVSGGGSFPSGVDVISGGATRGANLFHSFAQFSVLTGGAAYFSNAGNIQNIISRVTGASISNINGLIRANGKANLFLINPNGIVFGPNASLNIGGSFVASTASSLKFADGTEFSATNPPASPLLTISVPIGLQFGGNPGGILNQSQATDGNGNTVGLLVQPSNTLALVGGNVSLDGGSLTASGGQVELGGLAGAGTVGLNVDNNNLNLSSHGRAAGVASSGTLSFPNGVPRADVSLINGSTVNVTGGGGSIAINARNLNISGESEVNSMVDQSGVGNGTDISIQTRSLSLSNGAIVSTYTSGQGNAGNIQINASDSVSISSGSQVETTSQGAGNAGNVSVQAGGTVSVNGVETNGSSSEISSTAGYQSSLGVITNGKSGNVDIKAGTLSLTNGAELETTNYGSGDAGNVTINVSGSVSFDGVIDSNNFSSGVYSDVAPTGVGKAGDIIMASSLSVTKAGDINIMARSLSVTNGAELSTTNYGSGDAGSVTINASGPVSFDGVGSNGIDSGAFSAVSPGAMGKAGDINIMAGSLSLTNGARNTVSSFGQGNAGNLQIQAGTVTLDSMSSLGATTASNEGGNINLKVQDILLLRHGSVISATAGTEQAGGNGGNITLNTPLLVAIPQENSDISANAFKGNGGSVTINASGIFGTQFQKQPTSLSDITASSTGGGINGVVNINTPVINPSYGVATLPAIPVNVNTLIANTCIAGRDRKGGSFIVTGSGGLPNRPGDAMVSPYTTGIRSLPSNGIATNDAPEAVTATAPSTSTSTAAIVPATGWVFNNKGQVLLTAQAPSTTLDIPWLAHTTCHAD